MEIYHVEQIREAWVQHTWDSDLILKNREQKMEVFEDFKEAVAQLSVWYTEDILKGTQQTTLNTNLDLGGLIGPRCDGLLKLTDERATLMEKEPNLLVAWKITQPFGTQSCTVRDSELHITFRLRELTLKEKSKIEDPVIEQAYPAPQPTSVTCKMPDLPF